MAGTLFDEDLHGHFFTVVPGGAHWVRQQHRRVGLKIAPIVPRFVVASVGRSSRSLRKPNIPAASDQGREYFETALADPERAADRAEGRDTECEEMLYVAREAFAHRSKKPLPRGLTSRPPRPTGNDWKEEDLPRLLPRLAKKLDARG